MSFNQILSRFVWNGLGLAVLAAPIAIGSVHWPVWMTLSVLAGALLVAYILLLFRRGFRVRVDGVVVLMLCAGGLMLLQLVPLGESLLSMLSPEAAATVERSRELGFEVPTRISLDPSETVRMLCLLGTLLSIYVVAFNISYREGAGSKLLAVVGTAGGLVGAVTFAQALLGSRLILGFYEPVGGVEEETLFTSTFVNGNNAAGFLNLATLTLVGQWHKAQLGRTKGIYTFLVALTGAASIAMLSRGGFISLLAGVGLFVLMTRWSFGSRRGSSDALIGGIGLVLTLLCTAIFLLLFDMVIKHTEGTSLLPFTDEATKAEVWKKVVPVIKEFWLVGAGGGGFYAAFNPFNDFAGRVTILHAENELLEPLLEFGIPAGVLLLGSLVFLFWRRVRLARRDAYYAGAFVGLLALGIQSVADFGIRIPGVVIPAAVAMAALSGQYARDTSRQRNWLLRLDALKALPMAVVVYMLLVVGGVWVKDRSAEAAYARVSASSAGSTAIEDPGALFASEVATHPRDFYLFNLLGECARGRGGLEEAQRLFKRASELCPACVAPKVGMAKLHFERGEHKEALEKLLTVAQTGAGGWSVFKAVLSSGIPERVIVEVWGKDPDLLFELIKYSRYLGDRDALGRTEALILESLASLGYEMRYLDLLGSLYLAVGRLDKADETATYLIGLYPEEKYGYALQARVFVKQGRLDEAVLMYEEAMSHGGEDVSLALEMMGILARTRSWDRFEAMAVQLRTVVARERHNLSLYHSLMAMEQEMRGNYFAALGELDQAEAATPFDVTIPLKKAALHLKLNRVDKAAAEYRKALKIDPHSSAAAEGLRKLETHHTSQESLL